MRQVNHSLGADPELFIERDGKIVGSEKAIPKNGLVAGIYSKPSIVRDGVQLELHPVQSYSSSLASTTSNLSSIFKMLKTHLDKTPEIKACFKPVIEVSKEELASLSDESRVLGCQPSKNYYGLKMPNVDPVKYRKRSAGGHVHFGLGAPIYKTDGTDYRSRLVPINDLLLGTISCLIDLDPDQKERRKLYGMAGEYRLPIYGLEYRTLSNFWLRSVPLYQLVMGLATQAVAILHTTLISDMKEDIELELLESVDFKRVVRGIQKNDYDLARDTFDKIKPFIMKHFPDGNTKSPLYASGFEPAAPIHKLNMNQFEKFLDQVKTKGLDSFFPIDADKVIENWLVKTQWTGTEWLTFLDGIK